MKHLTIAPQAAILAAIERHPKLAASTKQQYRRAIAQAQAAGVNLADPAALRDHAAGLKNSARACLKAAVMLWAGELATQIKASATPDNLAVVQAAVYRLEALAASIKVESRRGEKSHTWLTQAQVRRLLAGCDDTLRGKRDRVVLSLLVGAGLLREELAALRFDDIAQVPTSGATRTVLNIRGKGAKRRVVPVGRDLAATLADWRWRVGGGQVARSVAKGGALGEKLSAVGIFYIVRSAGQAIGAPALAPHDLRRTYAQLGYQAGVPITQISKLLGHSSITTTQRYLNLDLNLSQTVSDFVPLE